LLLVVGAPAHDLLELVHGGLEILGGDRDRLVERGDDRLAILGARGYGSRQRRDQRGHSYRRDEQFHCGIPSIRSVAHWQLLSRCPCSWRIERSRPASTSVRLSPSSRHSSTTTRNDLIRPRPSPNAAHSLAGLLPPLAAGSILSISTLAPLVMDSHSSARAAAAAKPSSTATTAAARTVVFIIMGKLLSPVATNSAGDPRGARVAGGAVIARTPAVFEYHLAAVVKTTARYGLAWSMNLAGGASPHCEVSASSAATRFEPFAR